MIRLVTTELTRLRWRRAVLVLLAAAVFVPALIGIGTAWDSRSYSTEEIEQAYAQAREQPGFEREVRVCEKHPRRYGLRSADACEEEIITWWSQLYREPLSLRSELHNSGVAVASILLAVLILVGTTFAGADWNTGSMSNQLLFEPRRLRVWWAKAIAVGLLAALVAVVVMTLYWVALSLVATSRDLDAPPGLTGEIAWMIARCSFLATVGALAGYALTMLSRSTVFTLGAMFAVSALGTLLVAALPLGADRGRWLPSTNVLAVIQGKARYWREPPLECNTGDPGSWDAAMRAACNGEGFVTLWQGLVYVIVPLVVIVALSLWSFRRRDVP